MSDISLFFGSSTGNTETSAQIIADEFSNNHGLTVKLVNVSDIEVDDLVAESDKIIVGVPTWDDGELQQDWDYLFEDIDDLDFSEKKIALFGHGDAMGYPDTYQDAIGILAEKFRELGAKIVGLTSVAGYDFEESKAVEDGKFLGLCLDNDNEEDLTEPRITSWVSQLATEF